MFLYVPHQGLILFLECVSNSSIIIILKEALIGSCIRGDKTLFVDVTLAFHDDI